MSIGRVKVGSDVQGSSHAVVGLAVAVLAAVAVLSGELASGQPGRRNVLDDVRIEENGGGVAIDVSFNFPIRYVKHFPIQRGEEIRIELDPIAVTEVDREALFGRESIASFAYDDRVPLVRVSYEGDIELRPFLTIELERPVTFRVQQGEDFRSIKILLPGPSASDAEDEAEPAR